MPMKTVCFGRSVLTNAPSKFIFKLHRRTSIRWRYTSRYWNSLNVEKNNTVDSRGAPIMLWPIISRPTIGAK